MGHANLNPHICEGPCSTENQPTRSLKLLVAEDNAMIARVLVAQLVQRGHLVTLAVNGDEAVLACAEEQFDAVLMDCQMPPGLDGFGATRVIRALDGYADVPIIALISETFEGVQQHCRDAGMSGYLFKPASPCRLRVCLEYHTGLSDAMFCNYDTTRGEIFSSVTL